MQVSPGRNYATGSYDYAMSIISGSSRQLYAELLAVGDHEIPPVAR